MLNELHKCGDMIEPKLKQYTDKHIKVATICTPVKCYLNGILLAGGWGPENVCWHTGTYRSLSLPC